MMRMKHSRTTAALTAGLGVGVAAVLAGCGSGSQAGAAGSRATSLPSATSTTRAAPTSHPSSTTSGTRTSTTAPRTSSAPSTAHGGTAPAAGSGMPRCTTAQLRVAVQGNNADMQGSHSSLQFTNTGSHACELTGAPGVSYVTGDQGRQVGLPAKRVIGHTPTVLEPGATVSAGLFRSSAPQKTPSCRQVKVRGLRVYPPDSRTALFAPSPGVACKPPLNGPYLKVGPVLPGAHNTI